MICMKYKYFIHNCKDMLFIKINVNICYIISLSYNIINNDSIYNIPLYIIEMVLL